MYSEPEQDVSERETRRGEARGETDRDEGDETRRSGTRGLETCYVRTWYKTQTLTSYTATMTRLQTRQTKKMKKKGKRTKRGVACETGQRRGRSR